MISSPPPPPSDYPHKPCVNAELVYLARVAASLTPRFGHPSHIPPSSADKTHDCEPVVLPIVTKPT